MCVIKNTIKILKSKKSIINDLKYIIIPAVYIQ